jgi:hypothetical protein
MVDNSKNRPASPADPPPRVSREGQKLDPTPPPDHQGFVEARSNGLRAMRENLARRKKSP